MAAMRVHNDRAREMLGATLSDRTITRLLGSQRLQKRLTARLHANDESDPHGHWRAVIEQPFAAVRRAGAFLHAQALRTVLAGPEVKALVAAIGRDAHAFGLRHGADAEPRDHGGDLAGAIVRDGEACLGAWLSRQPSELRRQVLLQIPANSALEAGPFPDDIAARADAVMETVARDASRG